MMTTAVKGKRARTPKQLIQEFRDMATGKLDTARARITSGGSLCSPACATFRRA